MPALVGRAPSPLMRPLMKSTAPYWDLEKFFNMSFNAVTNGDFNPRKCNKKAHYKPIASSPTSKSR